MKYISDNVFYFTVLKKLVLAPLITFYLLISVLGYKCLGWSVVHSSVNNATSKDL